MDVCGDEFAACEIQKRFAEALRNRSNAEIARLTGFHPEAIRRYRLGRTPPASLLAAMCLKLGLSADWLLLGRGPMMASEATALQQAVSMPLTNGHNTSGNGNGVPSAFKPTNGRATVLRATPAVGEALLRR